MGDALLTQKAITKYYDDSVLESATPGVRSDLIQLHSDERNAAFQVWQEMNRHGWYNVSQANQQQLGNLQNIVQQGPIGGMTQVTGYQQGMSPGIGQQGQFTGGMGYGSTPVGTPQFGAPGNVGGQSFGNVGWSPGWQGQGNVGNIGQSGIGYGGPGQGGIGQSYGNVGVGGRGYGTVGGAFGGPTQTNVGYQGAGGTGTFRRESFGLPGQTYNLPQATAGPGQSFGQTGVQGGGVGFGGPAQSRFGGGYQGNVGQTGIGQGTVGQGGFGQTNIGQTGFGYQSPGMSGGLAGGTPVGQGGGYSTGLGVGGTSYGPGSFKGNVASRSPGEWGRTGQGYGQGYGGSRW